MTVHPQNESNKIDMRGIRQGDTISPKYAGNGPGQGTSAGHEINDGHCVSPPGHPANRKDLEEDWRDVGETN